MTCKRLCVACLGAWLICQQVQASPTLTTNRAVRKVGTSVEEVTSALKRYNTEEVRLFESPPGAKDPIMLPAPALLAHWQMLHELRTRLEQLDRHDSLRSLGGSRRLVLRHELAVLLGGSVDVGETLGDYVEEKISEADLQRKQDLVAIAQLVNRALDFSVESVLGIPVERSSEKMVLPPPDEVANR